MDLFQSAAWGVVSACCMLRGELDLSMCAARARRLVPSGKILLVVIRELIVWGELPGIECSTGYFGGRVSTGGVGSGNADGRSGETSGRSGIGGGSVGDERGVSEVAIGVSGAGAALLGGEKQWVLLVFCLLLVEYSS